MLHSVSHATKNSIAKCNKQKDLTLSIYIGCWVHAPDTENMRIPLAASLELFSLFVCRPPSHLPQ